ncbi:hypothetical protein BX600DRAFT_456562 [Xylariales sp. PMI_506]|nr:hypothetical protein BX600DRAFT_456562 [Xylariales sp. PMI_506]
MSHAVSPRQYAKLIRRMTGSRTPLRRLGQLSSHLHTSATTVAATPATATAAAHVDLDSVRTALLSRPEQLTYDVLSPMPTHLMGIALSDYLPASAIPPSPILTAAAAATAAPSSHVNLPEPNYLLHWPLQLAPSALCPDGTDPYPSPGGDFERRMWAGGSLTYHAPLALRSQRVVCRESIEDVRVKGRQGEEKIFVDILRRYGEDGFVQGEEAITERRIIVFMRGRSPAEARQATSEGFAPRVVKAPSQPTFSHTLTPTTHLLFNYSALSYNAHQIHLNPQYCREVEGHRDLLVHGPLSFTLMLYVLRSQLADGERIVTVDYRNLAPLYVSEPLTVCVRRGETEDASGRRKWDIWVEGKGSGLCVKGTAIVIRST